MATDPPPIAGLPLALASLDIHTVGCGGGSLARVDAGGALHVGPKSAGADPGPVAYGRAEVPTLTDAFVQLGRIQPGVFLAGQLELDRDGVTRAFESLARELGLSGSTAPDQAAEAMIDIARAAMGRAISAMTLQRGRDPRRLALVAFGGAGGLVAAELGRALGMPEVLVPRDPGVLSARGLASAGFEAETTRSLLSDLAKTTSEEINERLGELEAELRARAAEENVPWKSLTQKVHLELRYHGQTFALRLLRGRARSHAHLRRRFDAAHEHFFGHALEGHAVELVGIHLHVAQRTRVCARETPGRRRLPPASRLAEASVRTEGSRATAPVLDRATLPAGAAFTGPAIVVEYSSTTWVPPGVAARITGGGHLRMSL